MFRKRKAAGGVASALLAAALMVSGCGSESTEKSGASPAASAGTASTAVDMSKPVKLKWILYGEMAQDSQKVWDAFNKELQTVLPNTTVEIVPIDSASYNDKTRLIVASGEDYDLMWAANWKGDYRSKITGGAFMPVQELIEKHAPGLKKAIPANDWAISEIKGVLYGIPSHQTIINGQSLNIPSKYYDVVTKGVDVAAIEAMSANPKISFVEVLRKIEPLLENAKAGVKEYAAVMGRPLMVEKNYESIINGYFAGVRKGDKDLKVYSIFESQEYKDMVVLAKEWQKKGYFAKDLATFLKSPANKISAAVNYGNYTLPMKQNEAVEEKLYGPGIYSRKILVTPPLNTSAGGVSSAQFISKKSKNPERAIKLLEVLNTNPKLYNLLSYGLENEHYKLNADGTVAILNQNYKMRDWIIGNTDNSIGNTNNKELIQANTAAMSKAPVSPIMGFLFDMEPVKNEIASLTALMNEYKDGLEFGQFDDPVAKYNEMVGKMKTAGIDKVVQEAQNQIHAWAKTKGITPQ